MPKRDLFRFAGSRHTFAAGSLATQTFRTGFVTYSVLEYVEGCKEQITYISDGADDM